MKLWRETRNPQYEDAETAARFDRHDAIQLEAIKVFVSESAALMWVHRRTHDMGGWRTPYEAADESPEGLQQALAYLHGLGITPLPPDPPSRWKQKAKPRRRWR